MYDYQLALDQKLGDDDRNGSMDYDEIFGIFWTLPFSRRRRGLRYGETDIRRLNINICQNPKRGPSLEAPSNSGYEEPRSCARIGEADARPAKKRDGDGEGRRCGGGVWRGEG